MGLPGVERPTKLVAMPSLPVVYVSAGDTDVLTYIREQCGGLLRSVCVFDATDQPGSRDPATAESLRTKIAACNAVLHVAGRRFEPPAEGDEDRRSLAWIEHDMASRLGKPLYIVQLGEGFPRSLDPLTPIPPEPEKRRPLQKRHGAGEPGGLYPLTTVTSVAELTAYVRAVAAERPFFGRMVAASLPPPSLPAAPAVPVLSAAKPEPAPPEPPSPPPENVVFTAYRPGTIRPGQWEKLLFFAHLDEKPVWMDEDERTPIEEVEVQAAGLLGRKLDQYSRHSGDSRFPVPRDGEITLAPEMAGVEFDPPRRAFFWREEVAVHGETFRLRAAPSLEGQIARGRLTVFLGALILAEIGLAIRVGDRPVAGVGTRKTSAAPFRKIFASYSHRDVEVVETLERHARTLGDEYLRDWLHLRSGEQWDERLLSLVEQADVFQLFWSHHSACSPFVEREWRHALRLGREAFVRPTYWELPMPPPPPDLAGIHFHRLTAAAPRPDEPEPSAASAPPAVVSCPPVSEKDKTGVINLPPPVPVQGLRSTPPAQVRHPPAALSRMPPVPRGSSGRLRWWLVWALILVALAVGYWFLRHPR